MIVAIIYQVNCKHQRVPKTLNEFLVKMGDCYFFTNTDIGFYFSDTTDTWHEKLYFLLKHVFGKHLKNFWLFKIHNILILMKEYYGI